MSKRLSKRAVSFLLRGKELLRIGFDRLNRFDGLTGFDNVAFMVASLFVGI